MCRNGRYTERGIKEIDGYASQLWTVEPEYAVRLDPALESVGMLLQFAFTDGALTFLRAQLHLRNQTAEILISGAGRDEERKAERIAD